MMEVYSFTLDAETIQILDEVVRRYKTNRSWAIRFLVRRIADIEGLTARNSPHPKEVSKK